MTLNVATYSQILTILTQLATNYTNLITEYYKIFYDEVPADVEVQYYNSDGELTTITIPNRAKDRSYILNGNGDPNGRVSGAKGSVYQDLTNGKAYLNVDGTLEGWVRILTEDFISEIIIQGSGSPEGVETAKKGILFIDVQNASLYIKSTETGNTGWVLISASTGVLANRDLDNLTRVGEAHFANPSLSNLNNIGRAVLLAKENVENKITSISNTSTDTQYPSAKAVYGLVSNSVAPLANKDLSNLTSAGEDHFANKSFSNINSTAQAMFDAKENKSNKVTVISSTSSDNQYPSAKAAYDYVTAATSNLAKNDLSNMTNVNSSTKNTVVGWGMPRYSGGINISFPYTVSSNGFVYAHCYTGDSDVGFTVNGNYVIAHRSSQYGGIGTWIGGTFPVSAGDVVRCTGSQPNGLFYPIKGA